MEMGEYVKINKYNLSYKQTERQKSNMITSVDTENPFGKNIQWHIMIKYIRYTRDIHQSRKSMYIKPTPNNNPRKDKLNDFH